MTPPPRLVALLALLAACAAPARPPVAAVAAAETPPAPPADPDGDGLAGDADRCPDAPEDCDGFEDGDGCPDADNDHDGVVDGCDACPNEEGHAPDGCPHRVVVEQALIRIIENVYFDLNRVELQPRAIPFLTAVSDVMRANPQILRVEVQGHASADERGAQALSDRRAALVAARLTALGVDAARLVARGYGSTAPVQPGTSPEGRARNRRVELHVLDVAPPPDAPPRQVVPAGCPDAPPPAPVGPCARP